MPKRVTPSASESNRLHRELATAVVSFQEAVARSVGMSAAERKCAGLLAERGRMTPGELAHATGLTTGGPYTVTASANGFQGQTVEGIQTTLQGPTQLTFALARPSGAAWPAPFST